MQRKYLPYLYISAMLLYLLNMLLVPLLQSEQRLVGVAASCNVTNDPNKSPYKGTKLGVHPKLDEVRKKIDKDLEAAGIKYQWTQGFRSADYQHSLYLKGRGCPGSVVTNADSGSSYHEYGLALDFTAKIGGNLSWDANADSNGNGKSDYQEYGAIAQKHGVEWGGAWKSFVDLPHIQMTMGKTIAQLRKEGPPDADADWKPEGASEEDAKDEKESDTDTASEGKSDILDMSAYKSIFAKYENTVQHVGVKEKQKEEYTYMDRKINGTLQKVMNVFITAAQVLCVILIGYLILLTLIYILAKTTFSQLDDLLIFLTRGYIDSETSVKKFGLIVAIALFFLIFAATGLLAGMFIFIYQTIIHLIDYLTYSL